ncbi:unnamed protein product, partial [marine sediment metagenome]
DRGRGDSGQRSFENPTCDPDPCAVELVRVVDLSDTDDRLKRPELLEDSKSDVRAEKFGEIDAYRLELLARKKGGKPWIAIRATAFIPVPTTDCGSACPEAVGRASGGIRMKDKTDTNL